MSKAAILQSNYIPWKGYFDLIASVDVFVIYDDMQYTKRDWRNRNRIKTPQGIQWLTIPVQVKGKYTQKINETRVSDHEWVDKHLRTVELNYRKSKYFTEVFSWLENLYKEAEKMELLSDINILFIKEVCKKIGIHTQLVNSTQFKIEGIKSESIMSILNQIGGVTSYLSGPAAKVYLDEKTFIDHDIEVVWMDYNGYPEYTQLYPPFEHAVTIIDLFFNECEVVKKYMKSVH